MGAEEVFEDLLLTLRDGGAELDHGFEELFDGASGLEEDKHSGLTIADHREGVRYFPGSEGGITGFKVQEVVTDLNDEFALNDEKPFVLAIMHVQRGAAFFVAERIIDTELATRIFRGDLTIELTAHEEQLFVKAIFSVLYFDPFRGFLQGVCFGDEGGDRQRKLTKQTTIHMANFRGEHARQDKMTGGGSGADAIG